MKKIVSLSILDTVIYHGLPIYDSNGKKIDKEAFLNQSFWAVYNAVKQANLYFQPEDVLEG